MTTNIPIQYGSASQGFTGEVIMTEFPTKESFVEWGKEICFPGLPAEQKAQAMEVAYDVICMVMKPDVMQDEKIIIPPPVEDPAPVVAEPTETPEKPRDEEE